jgi:DNA-binding transcriptional LysR family regulator
MAETHLAGPAEPTGREQPQFKDLIWFLVASNDRSFRAAARSLGVGYQALANRIGQLEKLLGVALFRRSSRGRTTTPTVAGVALQTTAQLLLRELDSGLAVVRWLGAREVLPPGSNARVHDA